MQSSSKVFLWICSLFCLSICLSFSRTEAAEITVHETGKAVYLIAIRGEITDGDASRFERIAALVDNGAVLLESPGGLLLEGLRIGQRIRENGYSTGVAPETECASACALIWLGGELRFLAPSAMIGFHAAFTEDPEGEKRESGMANAMIGMYLSELGFGLSTVVFTTSAGPNDVNWLNANQAMQAGISHFLLEEDGTQIFVGPKDEATSPASKRKPLKLDPGFRWVVLQSAKRKADLSVEIAEALIVKTKNGYFAKVLGPFERATAEQLLNNPSIPADAYLSSGNGFLHWVE